MTTTNDMGNIDQRLAEIERTQERVLVLLESLTKQVGEQATADREWRARHDLVVSGDGNGNPGLRLRVDRLEQSAERSKWALRTVAAAVLALLGKVIADALHR
jgi:hypothetical protein